MAGRVAVLGGGISGLLLASALAPQCDVCVLEAADRIPRHKYWLSDRLSLEANPQFADCVDRTYAHLDFLAYDHTSCRIPGTYNLWNTERLLARLLLEVRTNGGRVRRHSRFYSYRLAGGHVEVLVNDRAHKVDLVVDCMGLSSPIVSAKRIMSVSGFYLLYGKTVRLRRQIDPVGLHNVVLARQPAYFELLPARDDRAHASMIIPARTARTTSTLAEDFDFVVHRSPYRDVIADDDSLQPLHGVIPIGRQRVQAIDHVYFYGEAGHVHPAASAAGISLMLTTYRDTASHLISCLLNGTLGRRHLNFHPPVGLSPMNRSYQESMARVICESDSDRFRDLVLGLSGLLPEDAYDLIFGRFPFCSGRSIRLLNRSRRNRLFGMALAGALRRYLAP